MVASPPESAASPPWLARVMLNEPVGLLDYRVPEALVGALRPGMAVRVTLGKRQTGAYVTSLSQEAAPEGVVLKDLEGIDEERPPLPDSVMALILFAADYYGAPPGDMLSTALPASARPASRRYLLTEAGRVVLQDPTLKDADRAVLQVADRFANGFTVVAVERSLSMTRTRASSRLRKGCERGWLVLHQKKAGIKEVVSYKRAEGADTSVLSARQAAALELFESLPADGTPVALAALVNFDQAARGRLKTLEKAGLVLRESHAVKHLPYLAQKSDAPPPEPTPEQTVALAAITAAIDAATFSTFLVHGVTGSGKTEIYLRSIAHALDLGRTALILVPEIALTPQLGERFRSRFGGRVATFHSGLTSAERRDEWQRVVDGEAQIGLGARSALFLPLENLGIIIIDEEHETSFKQDESPRYHARDLAVWRGRQENAVVLLGSATPSLETFTNAQAKRYNYVELKQRVQSRPMPEVECVSLTDAVRVGEGILTERLATDLEHTLSHDEQAILFLNRRGFAPYVYCRDCGHSYRCEDCDVSLTLHQRRGILMCHYCGFECTAPDECGACSGHKVGAFGLGTERLEAEIKRLYGDIDIVRLDRDVVRNKNDLEAALGRFQRREAKLLIGTQMVAKGHDFPGVTLVGVVSADASLNFPDFRASERTFQLLSQVAGRAGRGTQPGHVIVQAYETEHYAIRAARTHDYHGFVDQELVSRKELDYPPYTYLALIRCEGPNEEAVQTAATESAESLRQSIAKAGLGVTVLGPAPAPLSRLRGQFRVHILLKGKTRTALRHALSLLPRRSAGEVRRIVDVDPVSML